MRRWESTVGPVTLGMAMWQDSGVHGEPPSFLHPLPQPQNLLAMMPPVDDVQLPPLRGC